MRIGFSTGSCAALAAKAAARMLLSRQPAASEKITTPKGIVFESEILDAVFSQEEASCAVRKDGGDDPDVTTGLLVYATVSHRDGAGVEIRGGEGVGVVTRPGLDQPVGAAAINRVPRRQIEEAVREVMDIYGYDGGLTVVISVPGGEKIARGTFNLRLGIRGGISIIGTKGIVEPMSEEALLATIRLSLLQRRSLGEETALIAPGNYALASLRRIYGVEEERCVLCSNYIGRTLDMARELGFSGIVVAGHIGKLVKLGMGIMNTHSREGDGRLEALAICAMEALEGSLGHELVPGLLRANTTEEALELLEQAGVREQVMKRLMERILSYLKRRVGDAIRVECLIFSNMFGEVGGSDGAGELLQEMTRWIRRENPGNEAVDHAGGSGK